MLAVRCVRAEIYHPTKIKERELRNLCVAWQSMTKTHSTYRTLRNRFPNLDSRYARAASFNLRTGKEPLHLPKDMFRIVKADGKFVRFFLRIPTKAREYLWLPLRMSRSSEEAIDDCDYGDSKLVRRGERFLLHLTVKRKVASVAASSLLGIDLGERYLATAVLWQGSRASILRWFYGREARGIRRHYAWLRKRLGERRLLKEIRRISDKEKHTINDLCHEISREIVTPPSSIIPR
jgi:transposase